MPKENPHYQNEMSKELIKVTLDYNKATGAITDPRGTLICNWEDLTYYNQQSKTPNLPDPDWYDQTEEASHSFTVGELIQIINGVK